MDRRRLAPLALLGAALLATLMFSKGWPQEQTIHYVLGDTAPRVEEVDARWTADPSPGEPAREVSFRYPRGAAPRVVTHEPRLANGPYTVDLDVVVDGRRTHVVRYVALGGGVTSIDLSASGRVSARDDTTERRGPGE
jgi:hypothetical protein